jgi:hypothetical protein
MNKVKIVFLSMLMAIFSSQIAMANTGLAYAFGASPDTLQIELLDAKEMESTKGNWWRANISYDRKLHRFTSHWGPLRGNRAYFQINIWRIGVKGSDRRYRIPAGLRIQWGSHKR